MTTPFVQIQLTFELAFELMKTMFIDIESSDTFE